MHDSSVLNLNSSPFVEKSFETVNLSLYCPHQHLTHFFLLKSAELSHYPQIVFAALLFATKSRWLCLDYLLVSQRSSVSKLHGQKCCFQTTWCPFCVSSCWCLNRWDPEPPLWRQLEGIGTCFFLGRFSRGLGCCWWPGLRSSVALSQFDRTRRRFLGDFFVLLEACEPKKANNYDYEHTKSVHNCIFNSFTIRFAAKGWYSL